MSEIEGLTAVELVDLYRRKVLSPSEAVDAIIAHIERREPALNALYAFDPTAAREQAAQSTRRWAAGEPAGELDGVPVTIKENIATKGVPVPVGTAAAELTPSPVDAPPSARLKEAGAVVLGKTTMPDYGMLSSGLSSFHPLTRNPWNLALNPGGSSAGAAAAGAAGYGPLHLGTDIGGSVRLPAGWCGLVGVKPSHGRVPIDPAYLGRIAGPLTRTVADAALMMSVLSRPDWRDATSLPPQELPWMDLDRDPAGLRLGLMLDIGAGMALDPEVEQAVIAAARLFEEAGATVEIVPADSHARDARRPRRFLARAGLGRCLPPPASPARQDSSLHPGVGGIRRHALGPPGHEGLWPHGRDAQGGGTALPGFRLCAVSHRPGRGLPGRMGVALSTIPSGPSSTLAIPSSGTWPRTRRRASIAATRQVACPSGCRLSGGGSTISAFSGWRRPMRTAAPRKGLGPSLTQPE